MMGFIKGGNTTYKTADTKSTTGEDNAFGLRKEKIAVLKNKENTVKWGTQVEKALYLA